MTNGFLGFDHLDVRVPSLAAVEAFYDLLMPALGLTEKTFSFVDAAGDWHDATPEGAYNTVEFSERPRPEDRGRFIGFIEDRDTRAVRTRIAFLVATPDDVLAFERRLHEFGAREIEREANFAAYPAVFFSDPGGTRLEIIARRSG